MIYLPNMQVIEASGAAAMSGTLAATALVNSGLYLDKVATVRVTCAAAHGLVAGSSIYLSSFDNVAADIYRQDKMRYVVATPASTTLTLVCPEGYTAGTPTTSQIYAAGFVSDDPYWLIGFKLHLSAADTNGETLTLTTDAAKGAAWDELLFSKVMTGVTDIVNFPSVPIPMEGKDIVKFAWTNTGAKTWGLKMYVAPRV